MVMEMVLLVFTGDMTPLTCDGCLSVNGFSQPCLPPGTGEMLWTIGGLVAGGPLAGGDETVCMGHQAPPPPGSVSESH